MKLAKVLIAASAPPLLLSLLQEGGNFGYARAPTTGYGASLLLGTLAICYAITSLFRERNAGQLQELERTAFRLISAAVVLTLTEILLGCVWAMD